MITQRKNNSTKLILFWKKLTSTILMNMMETAVQMAKAMVVGIFFIVNSIIILDPKSTVDPFTISIPLP